MKWHTVSHSSLGFTRTVKCEIRNFEKKNEFYIHFGSRERYIGRSIVHQGDRDSIADDIN